MDIVDNRSKVWIEKYTFPPWGTFGPETWCQDSPETRSHLDTPSKSRVWVRPSDFQTGLGKISQRKECEFDEDRTHNSGFQTLKLSIGDQTIFANKAPGGSELLRIYSKTIEKDTQEKIIKEMELLGNICKEMPVHSADVNDVWKVHVKHHLVITLHDGKERLIMAQHNVATYHQQGIVKKPPGFGHPAKISTPTCQECSTDPNSSPIC